ncbi:hypothetical protein ACJJTC_016507 [Scirpophaga incertulas]
MIQLTQIDLLSCRSPTKQTPHRSVGRLTSMMNLCHLPPVKQAQPSFPQPLLRGCGKEHLPEEVVESIIPVEYSQPRQMSEPATSQQQRRRRSAAGSDVRSRLFQVEEERAEREILQNRELAGIRSELAGIKAELSQMSGLMREYLNNKNK